VGLAGKTFQTQSPQLGGQLTEKSDPRIAAAVEKYNSAAAVPLSDGRDIFGVFIIYGELPNECNDSTLQMLEAVGTRIAPLLLGSRAFENSLSNALTDSLTNLPNERAFYLVLENQIAESQRFPEKRSLTILAIDIVSFSEHNQRFGHASGDRLLLFAATVIKNQLRQMDFLARSMNDEFLVVLPTASEIITREIVERIKKTFVTNPFEISATDKVYLELSFGSASFGSDGEVAGQMLKHAVLRKQQAKTGGKNNRVLWFPRDYVN